MPGWPRGRLCLGPTGATSCAGGCRVSGLATGERVALGIADALSGNSFRPPAPGAIQVRKSGMVFSPKLSLQAWELVGQQILSLTDSASWWIADWLVYGEAAFQDRYAEAVKKTSLNYQTLRNYAWVARRFELSRRRDSLSFGHHAEVAALDPAEQDFWLRKAEEFGWSRNKLRNEVRTSLRERASADSAAGMPPDEHLRLQLTPEQFTQCEATARSEGLSVDNWAVTVLLAATADHPGNSPGGPH